MRNVGKNRITAVTLWALGVALQFVLLGAAIVGILLLIFFATGCATRPMTAEEQQREARKLGERMYEDTHPPAEPKRDPNTSAEMDGESPAITKRLEWDYAGPGPVWFEVWHSTNGLEDFSWSGGTNAPRHFSWLAKVNGTNGVTTFDYPLGDLGLRGPAKEFFIVRAVNEFGFSDWGR